MNVKQSIYKKFLDGSFALCTDAQIARKLKLGKWESRAISDLLNELVKEGKLFRDGEYRYGTAEQFGAIKGKITGNERGFAFLIPEDGSEDLFLPARALNGALHGDTVYAYQTRATHLGAEGAVLSVIERGYTQIVGTFYHSTKQAGYLHPDEKKYAEEIYVPLSRSMRCPDGYKAVAKITDYRRGKSPAGEIIEILGSGDDLFVEELSVIRAHKLREQFPAEVTACAEEKNARGIASEDLLGRVDLREDLIVTVDGEDTRDIDDAISVSEHDGIYHLGVHIADVSHYVERGKCVDEEALKRGTSVYFPDRVLPMLPQALSNGICSLNEGVDRLTLSCFMTVDKQGRVLSKKVAPSVIRSRHRLTYQEVTRIFEQDEQTVTKYPDLVPFVACAIQLTNVLKKARASRGSVTMDLKEAKILFRDGTIQIPDYERSISHEMIEQFMVLANESVASLMREKGYPFIYRVHERPAPEKAEALKDFLEEAGCNVKFHAERVTPADYRDVLEQLQDHPAYPVVNRVMLRSMMKAKYSPENVGHFGLASDCYCHFTSPIRRYPDLCIHRIVKQSLVEPDRVQTSFQHFVSRAASISSECEKNATEAEREVDALFIAAYMQDKIGQDFSAVVSGVTSYGVFVELKNTVEGFIPIDMLPDDGYTLVEERFLLRGTKHSFRLGDQILVKVIGIDWGAKRTLFTFLKKHS